jgi:hypothetical protein
LLGPADGRYVIRGPGGLASHVLVLTTLGAPERRAMLARRRKVRDAEPEPEPTPVQTTRATLVTAEPFADDAAAARWLAEVDRPEEAASGLRVINGVLHAHRAAAADASIRELALAQALVIRVGIGEGEQVAHGRWKTAHELLSTPTRAAERRASVLRPQERLAAILSGRDVALACEELVLRGRGDLEAGRSREAALQLRVALESAIAELAPWSDRIGMAKRIEGLRDERATVGEAANAALQGGLDDETAADVERILTLVEAALRARTQAELG